MPPHVKAGHSARYWREVEALGRLEVAILKDENLGEEERKNALSLGAAYKDALVRIAIRTGELATPESPG